MLNACERIVNLRGFAACAVYLILLEARRLQFVVREFHDELFALDRRAD